MTKFNALIYYKQRTPAFHACCAIKNQLHAIFIICEVAFLMVIMFISALYLYVILTFLLLFPLYNSLPSLYGAITLLKNRNYSSAIFLFSECKNCKFEILGKEHELYHIRQPLFSKNRLLKCLTFSIYDPEEKEIDYLLREKYPKLYQEALFSGCIFTRKSFCKKTAFERRK